MNQGGWRPGAAPVAFTALVVWAPAARATMDGGLDLTTALVRLAAAVAVAKLATGGLARLVNTYARTPAHDEADHPDRRDRPRRRRDDLERDDVGGPEREQP